MGVCFSFQNDTVLNETIKCDEKLTNLQEKQLKKVTLDETKQFSFEGMTVYGKVLSCYDGDTCRICFFYTNKLIQTNCRMLGYDSPEMKLSSNTPNRIELKEAAIKARDRLINLVSSGISNFVKIKFSKNDLYGRPLVDLYITNIDGIDIHINNLMIFEGHGKPYNGKKKDKWSIIDLK